MEHLGCGKLEWRIQTLIQREEQLLKVLVKYREAIEKLEDLLLKKDQELQHKNLLLQKYTDNTPRIVELQTLLIATKEENEKLAKTVIQLEQKLKASIIQTIQSARINLEIDLEEVKAACTVVGQQGYITTFSMPLHKPINFQQRMDSFPIGELDNQLQAFSKESADTNDQIQMQIVFL